MNGYILGFNDRDMLHKPDRNCIANKIIKRIYEVLIKLMNILLRQLGFILKYNIISLVIRTNPFCNF